MKTSEELNTLKEEFETLNKKLSELTDDELSLVTGGSEPRELPKPVWTRPDPPASRT
ncbi:MAG: hypothetical protein Q4F31_09365 [Eubacteriales bacterium]|nr:hypothetical protein [Eubacteriales bacterium]